MCETNMHQTVPIESNSLHYCGDDAQFRGMQRGRVEWKRGSHKTGTEQVFFRPLASPGGILILKGQWKTPKALTINEILLSHTVQYSIMISPHIKRQMPNVFFFFFDMQLICDNNKSATCMSLLNGRREGGGGAVDDNDWVVVV